jgi:hypothetical protein
MPVPRVGRSGGLEHEHGSATVARRYASAVKALAPPLGCRAIMFPATRWRGRGCADRRVRRGAMPPLGWPPAIDTWKQKRRVGRFESESTPGSLLRPAAARRYRSGRRKRRVPTVERVGAGVRRFMGRSPSRLFAVGYASAANGSTVVGELALRPEFSPQARMPPTARCASRGERRGLLVLTAGPVSCSAGGTPPARWPRPNPVERAGVLALFLARGSDRGMGRREDGEANRT